MSDRYTTLPLRDLPHRRLKQRKAHLLREIVRPHDDLSFKTLSIPRRRSFVSAAVLALVLMGTATAATTGWLTGRPAPPAVTADFALQAPQLGFHPAPGQAVLVAEDARAGAELYATTNSEGSYCLVSSAPWKRPASAPDGGTCIPRGETAAPLIAGLAGASSAAGRSTYLIAGRAADTRGDTIRFTDPNGVTVSRTLGASGFFLASVEAGGSACANGDWKPTFVVSAANGDEVDRSTITLARARPDGVCTFAPPHS